MPEYENRKWVQIDTQHNTIYELHFSPYGDDEVILKFAKDSEYDDVFNYVSTWLNVEDDNIIAESVEDAKEQFEAIIKEHFEDQISYYEQLIEAFDKTKE